MRHITKLFKAVSDPNRLRIIKMLEARPLCVCEITDILQLAPSTVSKHLAILREAKMILDHKHGKWVDYRLNDRQDDLETKGLRALLHSCQLEDSIIRQDAEKARMSDREAICNKTDNDQQNCAC